MNDLSVSIIKTLAYADLFSYPLKTLEISKYLISSRPIRKSAITNALEKKSSLSKLVSTDGDYFYLKGRSRLVALRQKRAVWGQKKMMRATRVARWLKLLPTVKMIGVTGALAMMNANKKDDLDLLFLVSSQRLWLTRGLIVFCLRLFRLYRRPGKAEDKICPNLFLDEANLTLPKAERNLFTAHEIAQLKCLWDQEATYPRFLSKNNWVLEFLPNAFLAKLDHQPTNKKEKKLPLHIFDPLINFAEKIAFRLQLFYMRSRRTREIVEPGRIFFHPHDRGTEILLKYRKQLAALRLSV